MRVTTSLTGDTVGFDGLRAVVGAGEGVVGRFPGIVCVARCPDPGPLRDFLALCASACGPDPGRMLARRLATWMSGSNAPGPELRFGTVAAAGEQLAVFLVGAVEARVEGLGGLTLSGAHAAIGTDRLFSRPRTPVVLSLDDGQVRGDPADVYDLQAGVVPGAAVVLHPSTFDRDEQDAQEGAALAGHEWFDTAELGSDDPLTQPSWSPDVPAQRTSGRNGVTHRPGMTDDGGWGASTSDADVEYVLGDHFDEDFEDDSEDGDAADPDLGGEAFAAEDDDPLNGSHGGRHALLFSGDPAAADALSSTHDDGSVLTWNADPRSPDLRALDPRTGDPPGEQFAGESRGPDDADLSTTDSDPAAGDAPGTPPLDPRRAEPRTPASPVETPLDDDRAEVGADLSAAREASERRPAPSGSADADSLFAPAGAGRERVDASRDGVADELAGDRRGDFADDRGVDFADNHADNRVGDRADNRAGERADDFAGDLAHVFADGEAPPPEQAASPASAPARAEPSVDLFAVGPRTDGEPDVTTHADPLNGRPPSPRPSARRAPVDQGPEQRGSSHPDLVARLHEARTSDTGGSAPVRPVSAAEATSTMPGLLFRPDGDRADVKPAPATSTPAVRPIPDVAGPTRGGARIRGYRCENGHLNDPRSPTCRQCGATIDERAGGLVAGPRPSLGRLVFDDGAAVVVDGGYLLGRMPEVDDRVRTGELRPIVVEDRAGSVSRVHAEIRVSGWDVILVDTGSRNGTFVSGPSEDTWTALPPRRSRRLLPGARVRVGARMFVFESSSTVR